MIRGLGWSQNGSPGLDPELRCSDRSIDLDPQMTYYDPFGPILEVLNDGWKHHLVGQRAVEVVFQ